MIHIKRFIDKMAAVESKMARDVVLPVIEARGLRDDISKLLSDLYELRRDKTKATESEIVKIEIKGGSFK